MDAALQQVVEAHKPYLTVTEDGKIKCELNGHCFPPKLELVSAFINGSKYKKLKAKKEAEEALPKYEPFLVPSINFPDKLFCALTNQLLTRNLDAVKQHLKGKRFQKAKERFQEDKQELFEEPRLADAMDEDCKGSDEEGPGIWVPEGVESDEGGEGEAGEEPEHAGMDEDGGPPPSNGVAGAAAAANGATADGSGGSGGSAGGEDRQLHVPQSDGDMGVDLAAGGAASVGEKKARRGGHGGQQAGGRKQKSAARAHQQQPGIGVASGQTAAANGAARQGGRNKKAGQSSRAKKARMSK